MKSLNHGYSYANKRMEKFKQSEVVVRIREITLYKSLLMSDSTSSFLRFNGNFGKFTHIV
jgi:hypothetical protein